MNKFLLFTLSFFSFAFLSVANDGLESIKKVRFTSNSFSCYSGKMYYDGTVEIEYKNKDSSICRVYFDSLHYYQAIKPIDTANSILNDILKAKSFLTSNKATGCTGSSYYSFVIGENNKESYVDNGCVWNGFRRLCRRIQEGNYLSQKSANPFNFKGDVIGYSFHVEKKLGFDPGFKVSNRFLAKRNDLLITEKILQSEIDSTTNLEYLRQYIGWLNPKNEKNIIVNCFNSIYLAGTGPIKPDEEIFVNCGQFYSGTYQYNINLVTGEINLLEVRIYNCY